MNLYFKKEQNRIISIDMEKYDGEVSTIDVSDIEQFYSEVNKMGITEYYDNIEDDIQTFFDANIVAKENNSLNQFNIKHWVSNRSYGEIIDMYGNNEIVKPCMQREFVWDSLKCSRLIESIIMGLPIPPLFLLEIENNKYELIDGFQRITTIYNYVKELPWYYDQNSNKRTIKSKLSKTVSKEIRGLSFSELDSEYQRIIKRSTIPLIEFKQLEPDNYNSKYMIFERINTGSEKLNSMQIRKALAYGKFINDLYSYANSNNEFKELFSLNNIKKDMHVEALLRVIVMKQIYYGKFIPKESGINDILNEYCESSRNTNIDNNFFDSFEKTLQIIKSIFNEKEIFRRVEKIKKTDTDIEENQYSGNLNIAILESFIGILMDNNIEKNIDKSIIKKNYELIISNIYTRAVVYKESNPFNTSTGSLESIKKRFEIFEKIIGN